MTVIPFSTDKAALVVFDPEVLQARVREPSDWWVRQPQHVVEEVAEGQVGLFAIGRHGRYRTDLRVGSGPNEAEAPFAVAQATGHGLSVVSGQVFVGAAERLPGEGRGVTSRIPGTGELLEVPVGDYAITVHVLHWREDDQFYDEDNEVLASAPADFLVELTPVPERLQVRDTPPPLLELIPRAQAKGQAKVSHQPPRRRAPSAPADERPRRGSRAAASSSASEGGGSGPPVAPRHVPEEVAPYRLEDVRAAFREVLYGRLLHPVEPLDIQEVRMRPRDRGLLAQEVELDVLIKKATRVREQLRMLEAKVNANAALDAMDAVDIQEPVTGIYEALDDLLDYLAEEGATLQPAPQA
ncbi:MAG: DUF6386 family protein [Planctomycetota bacterium]